jgi:hypothetical protein
MRFDGRFFLSRLIQRPCAAIKRPKEPEKSYGNLEHAEKGKRHEYLDHTGGYCRLGLVAGLYSAQDGHFHMNESKLPGRRRKAKTD